MTIRDAALVAAMLGPAMLLPGRSPAQTTCPAGGVALVQTRAIFATIDRYADHTASLQVFVNSYKVDVTRLQGVMDSAARAYQAKSALLPPSTRAVEVAKLDDQNAQIQQRIRGLQQQVVRERDRLLQPIEAGVQAVLDSIRTELRCAMIFDASAGTGIASANKALDLTQLVIARIDRNRTRGDTALFGPPRVALPGRP